MRCPSCGHLEDKVVDSRPSKDGMSIRRRRECQECGTRFTSYEHIELAFPSIIKKDGTREEYDREKLKRGIKIACNKLPISHDEIEALVGRIERSLTEQNQNELPAELLGQTVMDELQSFDPVAYIRFASVYREFDTIEQFLRELNRFDKVGE